MKKSILIFTCMACTFLWIAISIGHSRGDENAVWSKRSGLALRASDDPSAKQTAKADWNEKLEILEQKGKWLKVSSHDGEGWVYSGNVAKAELPAVNKNNIGIGASGMNAAASSRSLTEKAQEYASAHDLNEVAEQINWVEQENGKISNDDARDYLKSHNLGEYSGGGK
jgi:hypothetical protein